MYLKITINNVADSFVSEVSDVDRICPHALSILLDVFRVVITFQRY